MRWELCFSYRLLLATVLCCHFCSVLCGWVCEDESVVDDVSDCPTVFSYALPCQEEAPLGCKNVTFCYPSWRHCDGRVDCPDGSDEESCEKEQCSQGGENCAHGPCVYLGQDYCCEAEDGKCKVDASRFTWVSESLQRQIVYAESDEIHLLSIGNRSVRRLARSECCDITALTYSVAKNKVMWTAGQYVWEIGLNEHEEKRYIGVLIMECEVRDMAYDWITGNFYFLCENDRVIVCNLRLFTKLMLCANLWRAANLNLTSIALRPDLGVMYLASPSSPIFQIYQLYTDGSSLYQIFESEEFRSVSREVFDRRTETFREFSWEFVKEILIGADREVPQRMQHDNHSSIIFDWNGTKLYLPLNEMFDGHIMSLMDERRQPRGINYCAQLRCDHLCVLKPGGAVCMCDSHYKLMPDERTCCHKADQMCLGRDYLSPVERTALVLRDIRSIWFLHASYMAAVLASWITGAACFFLGRRSASNQRPFRPRRALSKQEDEKCTDTV